MGVHYFNFGYDENADICEELTPFQLMYIDNKLNGFVWQHNAPLTGSSQYPSFLVYRKVASSNTSRLEAHAGFFRLLMKVIFDPYVL